MRNTKIYKNKRYKVLYLIVSAGKIIKKAETIEKTDIARRFAEKDIKNQLIDRYKCTNIIILNMWKFKLKH